MSFLRKYVSTLQHVSPRKATLHLLGRFLVTLSIGVFFARQLEMYAGLMLIAGMLLMLPVLAVVLKERGKKRMRAGKKRR